MVVTRGHKGDALALQAALAADLRFVGLLGSRPKMVHVFADLEERGVSPSALARVHCPLGIEIGAQTPEEIAVSILAEMIAVRRGRGPGGHPTHEGGAAGPSEGRPVGPLG